MKNNYEEKLKQHAIDMEKITLQNIEESLVKREEYLKGKFRCIEEQDLAHLRDYYQQLMMSYRYEFENKLNYTMRKHNKNYKNTKLSLDNIYKNELNLKKQDLKNKLESKKNKIISEMLSFNHDELKAKETKYLEKIKQLEQREQQIQFFKIKIKRVIKNFVKLVNLKERQINVNYGVDENKLFQKYLNISEDDFKQLILDVE